MKSAVLPLFCFVAAWVGSNAQEGFYDSRYDYLDIDAILDNKRLVKNYVDCLLGSKPCSPEGKALKRILPEGLRTKCARCTPRQKHNALAILRRLRSEHPGEWTRLAARWDPSGDLTRRFEDYLDKDDNNRVDSKPLQPSQPPPQPPQPPRQPPQPIQPPQLPQLPAQQPVLSPVGDRFGPLDEEQAPSEMRPTIRSVSSTMRIATNPPVTQASTETTPKAVEKPTSTKRPYTKKPRPKPTMIWRPNHTLPPPIRVDLTPIYTGTMGIIDHFGNKIIKTTELVTDLLKNTVRVVAGGR